MNARAPHPSLARLYALAGAPARVRDDAERLARGLTRHTVGDAPWLAAWTGEGFLEQPLFVAPFDGGGMSAGLERASVGLNAVMPAGLPNEAARARPSATEMSATPATRFVGSGVSATPTAPATSAASGVQADRAAATGGRARSRSIDLHDDRSLSSKWDSATLLDPHGGRVGPRPGPGALGSDQASTAPSGGFALADPERSARLLLARAERVDLASAWSLQPVQMARPTRMSAAGGEPAAALQAASLLRTGGVFEEAAAASAAQSPARGFEVRLAGALDRLESTAPSGGFALADPARAARLLLARAERVDLASAWSLQPVQMARPTRMSAAGGQPAAALEAASLLRTGGVFEAAAAASAAQSPARGFEVRLARALDRLDGGRVDGRAAPRHGMTPKSSGVTTRSEGWPMTEVRVPAAVREQAPAPVATRSVAAAAAHATPARAFVGGQVADLPRTIAPGGFRGLAARAAAAGAGLSVAPVGDAAKVAASPAASAPTEPSGIDDDDRFVERLTRALRDAARRAGIDTDGSWS